MSYSISKTNYIINANSFGNNRTQRTSIDFGIYEPSTESTTSAPSFPSRVLEGPQVVFGNTTSSSSGSARIVLPSDSNILQSTGIPQQQPTGTVNLSNVNILQSATIQQIEDLPNFSSTDSSFENNMIDTLNNLSSVRRRTSQASGFASTFTTTRRGSS